MYDMTGPIQAGLQWAQGLNQALAQHAQLEEQKRAALASEAMRQQALDQDATRDEATQAHQTLADQLSVIGSGGQPVTNGNVSMPVPQSSSDGSPMGNVAQAAIPSSVNMPANPAQTVSVAGEPVPDAERSGGRADGPGPEGHDGASIAEREGHGAAGGQHRGAAGVRPKHGHVPLVAALPRYVLGVECHFTNSNPTGSPGSGIPANPNLEFARLHQPIAFRVVITQLIAGNGKSDLG